MINDRYATVVQLMWRCRRRRRSLNRYLLLACHDFSDLLTRVSGGWNGRGGLGTGNSSSVSRFKETTDPGFQGTGIEDLYANDKVIRHSLHRSCEVNNEFC